jgi:hypothetical protein
VAKVRISTDESQNLTVFTVSGDVLRINELTDAMTAFLTGGQPTSHTLWDCTGVDEIEISSEDIEEFVSKSEQLGIARRGGKTAWVYPTRFGYGLGRMGAILSELWGVPFETNIFRSVDNAKRRLGVG